MTLWQADNEARWGRGGRSRPYWMQRSKAALLSNKLVSNSRALMLTCMCLEEAGGETASS